MMNFDRVAHIYDATRGLPDDVLQTVTQAIVDATHATTATRFLELGIGTGRIALPMLRFGFPYTGIDVSSEMMSRLMEKVPADADNLTLVNGDITNLPFADGAFDVAMAVHVFHLIPEWRTALGEVRRVLTAEGQLVLAGNEHVGDGPGGALREKWGEIVRELGATGRPRYGDEESVGEWLVESGALIAEYHPIRWTREIVPAELIESISRRDYSRSWDIADDIMQEAHRRLLQWAQERYGDLSRPIGSEEEFVFCVAHWPVT
jgi:ubiquinone/menaquinone biosynthesis C-methylase UbiE